MTVLSLVLVLLSAVAHSTWNLLLKRSNDKEIFVWWMLVSASLLLAPLGIFLLVRFPFQPLGWGLTLATIGLHIAYFVMLGRGYARGDLSLVYPIARGMGPMLVPILAVVLLKERMDPPAIAGVILIVVGIYTISWWGNFGRISSHPAALLRDPGTRYAILTGFTIAAYSLVDKRAVSQVQPFLYMYLMTLGTAIGLAPYILVKQGWTTAGRELRFNLLPIVVAGLLTYLAYGLVLTALSLSRVSYVAPAREIGIVIGVLMGVLILREPFGRGRLFGSSIIAAGLALIAISP